VSDRTGQVWHVGNDEMWQIFVVLGGSIERSGAYEHLRLIISSNWDSWPGKVAPYPEDVFVPWEGLDYFRRIA
jgi:hypothetical protein